MLKSWERGARKGLRARTSKERELTVLQGPLAVASGAPQDLRARESLDTCWRRVSFEVS